MTRLPLLLATAALLMGSGAEAMPFVCNQPGVIDGDTIQCRNGARVRLWGIQAPERHHAGGPASTRALARIVTGHSLNCVRKGKSYNRIVAQCFIGSRDIAREMVRGGFAVDWPKYSGGYYAR